MSDLKIKSDTLENGVILINAEGYLDAHTFEELEKTIQELFEKSVYRIIVDLEKLDYISSAGCGVFIGAIGVAQENDGNIVLLRPSANVREVFDLLGLTQIFLFADDITKAQSSF
ncbi:MAG: STAS domain-containing protein [Planctomycetota bacterium]|nr:STAS domain-containing protein [Planctomycetota bacterium]MCZ6689528.1 STAS domain-containing protein [Planctomycetota bacterium]